MIYSPRQIAVGGKEIDVAQKHVGLENWGAITQANTYCMGNLSFVLTVFNVCF